MISQTLGDDCRIPAVGATVVAPVQAVQAVRAARAARAVTAARSATTTAVSKAAAPAPRGLTVMVARAEAAAREAARGHLARVARAVPAAGEAADRAQRAVRGHPGQRVVPAMAVPTVGSESQGATVQFEEEISTGRSRAV